ncbi:PASTA domain-containing protein [Streptomyces sp. NPDC002913]
MGDVLNTRNLAAALACLAATALVGCDPATTDPKPAAPVTAEPSTAAPAATPSEEDKPAESKAVLNFVGMGLQSAQDKAQAEGFYLLKSHDSAGRDRLQALDRNWKVCSQNIKAGKTVPTDTELDFGAVKLEETCPANDAKAPEAAGGKMPNLVGKSVKAARGALDSGTSITTTDAAEGRMVLLESNWQVCTQSPSPGTALNGQPVEFTAVKFEESCP